MISKLIIETWEISVTVKNDNESNYHIGFNNISFVKYVENGGKEIMSALTYDLLDDLSTHIHNIITRSDIMIKRRDNLSASIVFLVDAIIDAMKDHKDKPGFSLSARFISDYMEGYADRHGEFKLTAKYIGEDNPLPNNVERI